MRFTSTPEPDRIGFAQPNGSSGANSWRRFDNVAGYGSNTASTVGAIIFEIPIGFGNFMQAHEFIGYSYTATGGAWRARAAFYGRSTPQIAFPVVTYDTPSTGSAEIHPQIRMGRRISTGNPVIIFGDVATVWTYPKIQLTSSFIGYTTLSAGEKTLDNTPATALVTDLTPFDLIVTPFDNSITGGGGSTDASTAFTTGTLPVARGGTGGTATPTAGGAAYGNGTALAFTPVGTSKQVLSSSAASAPTWQTLDLSYLPDSWVKKSVRAATTANITLSGAQTIDGIAVTTADRVLVKNQTTASQNGIYDVVAGTWPRSADANTSAEVAGATINVDSGTQAGTLFTTGFKPTDTLGTTAMVWGSVLDSNSVQSITALKTFQHASGTLPLAIKARTTANGGQTANLMEFTDPDGNNWTNISYNGSITSLLNATVNGLISGNGLGATADILANAAGPATVGAPSLNSGTISLKTTRWTGTASADEFAVLTAKRGSATAGDLWLELSTQLRAPSLALTTALPVTSGGTGGTATPTAGGNSYGTGTAMAYTAAGTTKQLMQSNGAAAPTWVTPDLSYLPGAWTKRGVRAATTANITLSGAQTIDGIAVVSNDRVLVKNQTTTAQNGIYVVLAGAWARATDAAASGDIAGGTVTCDEGTVNGGLLFRTPFKPTDTLGTTGMYWAFMRPVLTGSSVIAASLAATTGSTTIAITFPVGQFLVAPKMAFSSDSTRLSLGFSALTATGCTILVNNFTAAASAINTIVHWTATA